MIPSKWLLLSFLVLAQSSTAFADDFDRAPIHYSKSKPNNAIARLQAALNEEKVNLPLHRELGYLPAVLKALDIPKSSQVLVFSKTSLQRNRISPKTPRALYFNDEVYVGYCQLGQVLEISAVDPQLGAVFYTLEQQETVFPRFKRENESCLLCHASSQTKSVPGHTIRSVYPDRNGDPLLALGTHRVDQTTPIDQRWGGWYVTGTHGKQTHLGNVHFKNRNDRETIASNSPGQNVTKLGEHFDTSAYLTPHSDIVALMVLEHQTEMHNLITRAGMQARLALHDQMLLNKELGRAPDYPSLSAQGRIRSVGEALVRYLLFAGEAKWTDKITGTSTFAQDFAKRGPRDSKGRSLRDFDLQSRLFKYPCSYLIYSDAFAQMPGEMKEYVYQRLHDVLIDRDYTLHATHLTGADRQAILDILRETKKDLPAYWQK